MHSGSQGSHMVESNLSKGCIQKC